MFSQSYYLIKLFPLGAGSQLGYYTLFKNFSLQNNEAFFVIEGQFPYLNTESLIIKKFY